MKKILNHIKKFNPFGLFAIGLAVGIAIMYLYFQPKLAYQEKITKNLTISTSNYDKKLSDLNKKYASVSAALQTLLNAPTPTPMVKYVPVAPSHPNLSSCTLQGNFYFCPQDNCYYNPDGTKTGTCDSPPIEIAPAKPFTWNGSAWVQE